MLNFSMNRATITLMINMMMMSKIETGMDEAREVKEPRMVMAKQAARQIFFRPNLIIMMMMTMMVIMAIAIMIR